MKWGEQFIENVTDQTIDRYQGRPSIRPRSWDVAILGASLYRSQFGKTFPLRLEIGSIINLRICAQALFYTKTQIEVPKCCQQFLHCISANQGSVRFIPANSRVDVCGDFATIFEHVCFEGS
jgi:hypothetical protein